MHAKIFSATTIGVDAHLVEVEVDLSFGMVQFNIVGLPDTAIKESRQRVQTALKNSGMRLPEKKITVNLAPADLKKEGTLFDLPVAVGVLLAAQHIEMDQDFLHDTLFIGELSLDGSIKFIRGALAIAFDAQKLKKKRIILPKANAQEAALIEGIEVIGVDSLVHLVGFLRKEIIIAPTRTDIQLHIAKHEENIDFNQVKGQHAAKRALQIAAAGRHNVLFIGSPGSGKTMLARRLQSIMPAMLFEEILQTSKVYSISGKLTQPLVTQRPFRDPHHTISQVGLVGGGSFPQPGEISLAHNGILFLDELTEFRRTTLEVLRQPLENKTVCISRAQYSITFPASFLLVAALNPCPCGYWGDKRKTCLCGALQISKYLEKLSGPLLDRIDLQIHVQSVEYDTIKNNDPSTNMSSKELLIGVNRALEKQRARFNGFAWNSAMSATQIEQFCQLTEPAEALLKKVFEKLQLSMRGYHKILKVARTIADIEGSDIIDVAHIQEASLYRSLDQALDRQKQ